MDNAELVLRNKLRLAQICICTFGYGPTADQLNLMFIENAATNNMIIRPTGFGKTTVFLMGALARPGCIVVFSPTVSLIADLQKKLKTLKIAHVVWGTSSTVDEKDLWRDPSLIIERNIKVIVTTPESAMANKNIQEALSYLCRQKYILRYVFDEAHLITSWGQQFRPAYINLVEFLQIDEMRVNITLVSATINEQTQRDLEFMFKRYPTWKIFKDVTWRSNLIIIVKKFLCNKFNENNDAVGQYIIPRGSSLNRKQFHCLMRFLNNENVVNCSGIIYTYCKKSCYDLQLALQLNGVLTLSYTSEITHHSKKTKQEVWMNGQIKIMIATSAFGLGIDKPDTKFVVIYELPDSMDTLVQMIGRAGRNGEKAYGLIFYSFGDYQAIRGNMNRTLTLRRKNGSSTLENRVLKQSMLRDFFAQIIFLENMDKCRHDQLQLISNGYNMIADFVEQCNALKNAPTLTMNIAILLLTGEMCDSVEPAVAMLPAYGCFMMCRKSIVSYLLLQALERKIIDMDFVEDNSADYRDHIVLVKSYNMDHDQQVEHQSENISDTVSVNSDASAMASDQQASASREDINRLREEMIERIESLFTQRLERLQAQRGAPSAIEDLAALSGALR
ncbi:hypothetical protein TKK_0017043 [Trichogramma kaykai]